MSDGQPSCTYLCLTRNPMTKSAVVTLALCLALAASTPAQSPPDLTGLWAPRGASAPISAALC